jgi:hypothetical protein
VREFLVAQQQNKTTIKGLWRKVTRSEKSDQELMKQI